MNQAMAECSENIDKRTANLGESGTGEVAEGADGAALSLLICG